MKSFDHKRYRRNDQKRMLRTLSGEIRDNVGQILSLAKIQLNTIEEDHRDPVRQAVLLREAGENISKAMITLREIARKLETTGQD